MVSEALRVALQAPNEQETAFGEAAGSAMLQLAEDRGLDTDNYDVYGSVIHHAALADLIVSAVRKPDDKPWLIPEPVKNWNSSCFLSPDGNTLRRIVLVSHWSDSRHYSECRSWLSLGEVCHYNLPLQMIVAIIGQERNGKRSSAWTKGFLHPRNHQLRFRKKSRATSEVFNDKWEQIWREDHAEITRETWLQAMLTDDILPEVLFRVDIPVPETVHRQRILDLAQSKLDRLERIQETPEPQLSTCDFPTPCQFRRCCHCIPEREPSEKNGFIILAPR